MMDIQEFINNFRNQFDDPESVSLIPETEFHSLQDWNSLTGLMTIVMADEEYGVTLTPEELKSAKSVQDLFAVIKSKSEK